MRKGSVAPLMAQRFIVERHYEYKPTSKFLCRKPSPKVRRSMSPEAVNLVREYAIMILEAAGVENAKDEINKPKLNEKSEIVTENAIISEDKSLV